MHLADCCAVAGGSTEENLWRTQHFEIRMGRIGDDAPLMRKLDDSLGRRGWNFEYLWPDPANPWTTHIIETYSPALKSLPAACKEWVLAKSLDGLLMDAPFSAIADPIEALQTCVDIQNAIAPAVCCANFSDREFYALNISDPKLRNAVGSLRWMMPWHFIQVGIDRRNYTLEAWRRLNQVVDEQIKQGKRVVAGIYDPTTLPPESELAAAMVFCRQKINLWWSYSNTANPAPGTSSQDFTWNAFYELAG